MDEEKHKSPLEDLYGDFENFDLGQMVERLKTENKMLRNQIKEKDADIEKLANALVELKTVNQSLTNNISSLFATAKTELERKENIIADLRRERDNITFRRMGIHITHNNRTVPYSNKPFNTIEEIKHENNAELCKNIPEIKQSNCIQTDQNKIDHPMSQKDNLDSKKLESEVISDQEGSKIKTENGWNDQLELPVPNFLEENSLETYINQRDTNVFQERHRHFNQYNQRYEHMHKQEDVKHHSRSRFKNYREDWDDRRRDNRRNENFNRYEGRKKREDSYYDNFSKRSNDPRLERRDAYGRNTSRNRESRKSCSPERKISEEKLENLRDLRKCDTYSSAYKRNNSKNRESRNPDSPDRDKPDKKIEIPKNHTINKTKKLLKVVDKLEKQLSVEDRSLTPPVEDLAKKIKKEIQECETKKRKLEKKTQNQNVATKSDPANNYFTKQLDNILNGIMDEIKINSTVDLKVENKNNKLKSPDKYAVPEEEIKKIFNVEFEQTETDGVKVTNLNSKKTKRNSTVDPKEENENIKLKSPKKYAVSEEEIKKIFNIEVDETNTDGVAVTNLKSKKTKRNSIVDIKEENKNIKLKSPNKYAVPEVEIKKIFNTEVNETNTDCVAVTNLKSKKTKRNQDIPKPKRKKNNTLNLDDIFGSDNSFNLLILDECDNSSVYRDNENESQSKKQNTIERLEEKRESNRCTVENSKKTKKNKKEKVDLKKIFGDDSMDTLIEDSNSKPSKKHMFKENKETVPMENKTKIKMKKRKKEDIDESGSVNMSVEDELANTSKRATDKQTITKEQTVENSSGSKEVKTKKGKKEKLDVSQVYGDDSVDVSTENERVFENSREISEGPELESVICSKKTQIKETKKRKLHDNGTRDNDSIEEDNQHMKQELLKDNKESKQEKASPKHDDKIADLSAKIKNKRIMKESAIVENWDKKIGKKLNVDEVYGDDTTDFSNEESKNSLENAPNNIKINTEAKAKKSDKTKIPEAPEKIKNKEKHKEASIEKNMENICTKEETDCQKLSNNEEKIVEDMISTHPKWDENKSTPLKEDEEHLKLLRQVFGEYSPFNDNHDRSSEDNETSHKNADPSEETSSKKGNRNSTSESLVVQNDEAELSEDYTKPHLISTEYTDIPISAQKNDDEIQEKEESECKRTGWEKEKEESTTITQNMSHDVEDITSGGKHLPAQNKIVIVSDVILTPRKVKQDIKSNISNECEESISVDNQSIEKLQSETQTNTGDLEKNKSSSKLISKKGRLLERYASEDNNSRKNTESVNSGDSSSIVPSVDIENYLIPVKRKLEENNNTHSEDRNDKFQINPPKKRKVNFIVQQNATNLDPEEPKTAEIDKNKAELTIEKPKKENTETKQCTRRSERLNSKAKTAKTTEETQSNTTRENRLSNKSAEKNTFVDEHPITKTIENDIRSSSDCKIMNVNTNTALESKNQLYPLPSKMQNSEISTNDKTISEANLNIGQITDTRVKKTDRHQVNVENGGIQIDVSLEGRKSFSPGSTENVELPKPRKRITPTPVKDVPVCSFTNILEKNSSTFTNSLGKNPACADVSEKSSLAKYFSRNIIETQFAEEGEIPILHLEELSLSNLDSQKPFDKSLLKLLDCMNVSNLDCDMSKSNDIGNRISQKKNLTFENVMNVIKSPSTDVVDNVGLSNYNTEVAGNVNINNTPPKQSLPTLVTSTPKKEAIIQRSETTVPKDHRHNGQSTSVSNEVSGSGIVGDNNVNSTKVVESQINKVPSSTENMPARFRRRCRIIAVRKK